MLDILAKSANLITYLKLITIQLNKILYVC